MRKIAKRTRDRRGMTLIYVIVILPFVCGICALAVDFGYVEYNKFQLQQIADAAAHDYMVLYAKYGSQASAQAHISTTKNAIFAMNGVKPTIKVTWGYWNSQTKVFSTSTSTSATTSIQVVASCKKAQSNAISLLFGSIIGQPTINMSATAVATNIQSTTSVTVAATANPYFAGMPTTITNSYGDDGVSNAASQVDAIPVVPGSYLTFTSVTGTTSIIYPSMPYYGPNGSNGPNGTATQHGQNWDGPILSANTENGIGNAIMPESSFMGLFLDDNQPDSTTAPATTVDWTQAAQKNQNTYTNLSLKSPFLIGDGKNGSTTKTFQVPAGATRLYLGVWDGVQYSSNTGSLAGSVNVSSQILIVQ